MTFKIICTLALVTVVTAVEQLASTAHSYSTPHYAATPIYKAAPVALEKLIVKEVEAPAHYEFTYAVHDEHTGDVKEQKETRKDDAVEGYYTLNEADGTRRIVHYTANKHDGFNVVVTYEGKPTEAPKFVKAVPTLFKTAPVLYNSTPIAYKAAPIAYQPTPIVYKPAPFAYKAAPTVAFTSSPKSLHAAKAPLYHVSFTGRNHEYRY